MREAPALPVPSRDAVETGTGSHAALVRNALTAGAFAVWLAIVVVSGATLAAKAFGFGFVGARLDQGDNSSLLVAIYPFGLRAIADVQSNFATMPVFVIATAIILTTLVATLLARLVKPGATLPVAFISSSLVVLAAAITTNSLGALLVAVTFIFLAWLCGNVVVCRTPSCPDVPIVRLPLSIAIGLGLLGLLFLLFAAGSALNAVTVIGAALVLLVAILTYERHRLFADASRLRTWRPEPPSWFEATLIGLAAGAIAFATLAVFIPEIMENSSDAVRQHLPIAREIWQTGAIPEFPQLFASRQPIQGQLSYAVLYGIGGVTAAKIAQAGIGLVGIAGIGGIGWLGGGRVAAAASAAIFATIPIGMWLLGHLYADVFAMLFTAAATLCVLLWQREGAVAWLFAAGALLGFGYATKVAMALVIVTFAAAILVIGRSPWQWRERLLNVAAFGAGTLIVVPWLVRGLFITGEIPGLSTMLGMVQRFLNRSSVTGQSAAQGPVAAPLVTGVGHSPFDLLLGPWTLTFDGAPRHYRVILEGEFGIALLLLLPLALLGPRNRTTAFLAFTAVTTYVGWVLSDQVSRHLLPTLVLASALAGIAASFVIGSAVDRPSRSLAFMARMGLVVSMFASLLYFLPNRSTRLPLDLLFGNETAAQFIDDEVWAVTALYAANAVLPPDTRVGYVSQWEGPQAYTEARLVFLGTYSHDDSHFLDNQLGTTSDEVLASLERLDLTYFIWDRENTRPEDWQSALLSGEFLAAHTRILAGDRDAYLFQVLPEGNQFWGIDQPQNLLIDPDFRKIRREDSPWSTSGRVTKNEGALELRRDATAQQKVPVTSGEQYLLLANMRCPDQKVRTSLTLRWLDDRGRTVELVKESVQPGVQFDDQFLWRIAPQEATFASIELGDGGGSRCEFAELGFYAAP